MEWVLFWRMGGLLQNDELKGGCFEVCLVCVCDVYVISQNKTIKAYSPDVISELNQKNPLRNGLDHNTVYSMPFRPFNEASIKNKVSCKKMLSLETIRLLRKCMLFDTFCSFSVYDFT